MLKAINCINSFCHISAYRGGRQFGEHVRSCDFESHYKDKHVCKFVLEDLGNYCTMQNFFGYDVGRPCILLKMNRVSLFS